MVNFLQQRVRETSPFFSGEDMNMTAMSKRFTLDRLLRICKVTLGSSFLDTTSGLIYSSMLRVFLGAVKLTVCRSHAASEGSG